MYFKNWKNNNLLTAMDASWSWSLYVCVGLINTCIVLVVLTDNTLVLYCFSNFRWTIGESLWCYVCSRFAQICDCCRWFGQQQNHPDDSGKTGQPSPASLRAMVCLLSSHKVTSSDISIHTKEVIAAALQQGSERFLVSRCRLLCHVQSSDSVGKCYPAM